MSNSSMNIVKRNGEIEPFQVEKISKVIEWATDGISGVNPIDIEINTKLNLRDGISTKEIHKVLIQTAQDMISEETPNYQYVAGNLLNYQLRKEVWGSINPPKLYDFIKNVIKSGFYDNDILNWYSEKEINKLGDKVDHNRDFTFTYAGIKQLCDKYLVQNRKSKQIFETPQFAYMLIAMTAFRNYKNGERLDLVKRTYDAFSKHKINLPTPIMAGIRTKMRSYASCCLVDVDDSMESIFASNSAVGHATAKRYGIGINLGRMRGIGAKVRNGDVIHTGVIPFLKVFEATVKSCQQNGLRGGGATVNFPIWHFEIESILQLRNNSGSDDTRVRKMDYCISLSKLFYERYKNNKTITLFSPHEVKDLYDAFGHEEFDELYVKYENDPSIEMKRVVSAKVLFEDFLCKQRLETGRIYIMNVDHANSHGAFLDDVKTSNLCVAPETLILTSDGYKIISEIENEDVEVWNGKKWSKTKIIKTGENQKLVKVHLSDNSYLWVTPYHKWYVVENYNQSRLGQSVEKRTHELKIGDKLAKFDLPVIDGNEPFNYPYTHGAYCGDGMDYAGKKRIWIYGEKEKCINRIEHVGNVGKYDENQDRTHMYLPNSLAPKFKVPYNSSIVDKIEWLAGLFDMDGTVARNGDNEALQLSSINFEFLNEIKLLLQTLGVHSKIIAGNPEGEKLMPDGRGGYKLFPCKETKRILISSNGLYQLCQLGFNPSRLIVSGRLPQREASQFVKVVGIEDSNRYDDTFCCNEPEEHKVVFNGVLTGNCLEVNHPLIPLKSLDDPDGEIGVCILAALNILEIKNDKDLEEYCRIIVYFLDETIDIQEFFNIAAKNFATKRRSLAIGVTNFAAWLAKHGWNYSGISKEGLEAIDEFFEKMQYFLLKASNELAKVKGKCEYFHKTKYSKGILPIDTYKKDVDQIVSRKLTQDWATLREDIKTYGLRHSTLTAQMPCESSSVIQNTTNGIAPVKDLIVYKGSKANRVTFVVPGINKWKYEHCFDMKDNLGYIKIISIIQKHFDMSISADAHYNPEHYEKGIPFEKMLKEIMIGYKFGVKNWYYNITNDGHDAMKEYREEPLPKLVGKTIELGESNNLIHNATYLSDEESACAGGACTL